MAEHGLQCGFCTPGMMMTARHLLDHDPDPDEATIREAITGKAIVVQRQGDKTETIHVAKVTSVKNGTVNFNDGDKSRAVKAEAIVATK